MLHGVRTAIAKAIAPSSSDSIYDALNPKGRRRKASRESNKPEDLLMTQNRRDDMTANAKDVYRNVATLQWMVRQTKNFCCTMDVQFQTPDHGLNAALREVMSRDCEAENIDFVGRMDWDDMRRAAMGLQLTVGDMFFVPLQEGTLQAVTGIDCRNPRSIDAGDRWIGGARLNKRGRVTNWNFREKKLVNTTLETVDRPLPARNVWQYIQSEDGLNQIRGVAPINVVLNGTRDVYEGIDHALAKLKLDQMMGVHVKYKDGGGEDDIGSSATAEGDEPDNDDTTDDELHLDFGAGPVVVQREDVEDVKLLTAGNPAKDTQEFLKFCILVALIALDLPYNFFDASASHFAGNRAAWILFERSCMTRRKTQIRLHKRMTNWRLWQWFLPTTLGGTGEFALPRGMSSIRDIKYKWVPRGLPWWKPQEELNTQLQAVAAGLKTMQGVCDENDLGIYEENLKQLQMEHLKAKEAGFDLQMNGQKLSVSLQKLIGGAA